MGGQIIGGRNIWYISNINDWLTYLFVTRMFVIIRTGMTTRSNPIIRTKHSLDPAKNPDLFVCLWPQTQKSTVYYNHIGGQI